MPTQQRLGLALEADEVEVRATRVNVGDNCAFASVAEVRY
jgi:hypothetical protein